MALLRQETIAGRGRGLVATRPLRAGEVLLRESPLLCYEEAEAAESATFCSHCFRLLSDRHIVSSPACTTATFCSDSCLESGSHAFKGISALKQQQSKFSFEEQTLARFLLAAYNLDSSAFAKLLDLEACQEQDEEVAKKLHAFVVELVPSATFEATRGLLARDTCNTFGLMAPSEPGEERKVRGYAMYEQASMFNHDCLPNACRFEYVDTGNTDIIVRAVHDIEEGTEVCLSYFPVDWAYGDRQRKLHEEYGFWCKCARCTVESQWKDDDDEGEQELEADASDDVEPEDDDDDDDDDDFGHAMFFVKYLCPVEECGGTMAPLPPGEADAQGLEGSMECNFCGLVRSDEEFHRDLEEHAVDDD